MVTRLGKTIALGLVALLPAGFSAGEDLKDLYFGEALYYAYQEQWFEALARLDAEIAQHYGVDEPERDSLNVYIKTRSSTSATSSSGTGCTTARAAPSRRCSRRTSTRPCGTKRPSAWRESTSRRGSPRTRCRRWRRSAARLRMNPRRRRVPARERLHGARAPVGRRRRAATVAGLGSAEGVLGIQPGHRAAQEGRPKEAVEQLDKAGQVEP